MPRATRSAAKPSSSAKKPYSKAVPTKPKKTESPPPKPTSKSKSKSKSTDSTITTTAKPPPIAQRKTKESNPSHLYTDDHPSTTLHGAGFKDAATATSTLELVSARSLLYQFQTINTMYHRAAHHPHSSTSPGIQAAMSIFRTWLDETYPALRAAQTEFPLLKKEVVSLFLPRIREGAGRSGVDVKWAERYVELGKGKRLANVLVEEERPGEADMARVRQDVLEVVVKERGEEVLEADCGDLWEGEGGGVSDLHLRCIAYGYSPCKSEVLIKSFASDERDGGDGT